MVYPSEIRHLPGALLTVPLLVACLKVNDVGDDIGHDQVQGDQIQGDQITVVSGCKVGEQRCVGDELQVCVESNGVLGMAVIKACAPGTCIPNSPTLCPDPPAPGTVPTCENAVEWTEASEGKAFDRGDYVRYNGQLFVCDGTVAPCDYRPLSESWGCSFSERGRADWILVSHCDESYAVKCDTAPTAYREDCRNEFHYADSCNGEGEAPILLPTGSVYRLRIQTDDASTPVYEELWVCSDHLGCEIRNGGSVTNPIDEGYCYVFGTVSPLDVVCP